MNKINKQLLSTLYKAEEINRIWQESQNKAIIEHPKFGWISPLEYRQIYHNRPCPYCGQKMVHGKSLYSCQSQQEAIALGWQYVDSQGKQTINQAGNTFFHPHYSTIDHKLNKARFPAQMFDYDNLQVICWQCNKNKDNNNNFDSDHTQLYLDSLVENALNKYSSL